MRLIVSLIILFSSSLDEEVVPKDWRIGHITPIFKKGSKSDPGNYRPVSLTSVFSKLMESVLREAIIESNISPCALCLFLEMFFLSSKITFWSVSPCASCATIFSVRDLVRLMEFIFSSSASLSGDVIPIPPSLGESVSNALSWSPKVWDLSNARRKVFLMEFSSGLRRGLMPRMVRLTKLYRCCRPCANAE